MKVLITVFFLFIKEVKSSSYSSSIYWRDSLRDLILDAIIVIYRYSAVINFAFPIFICERYSFSLEAKSLSRIALIQMSGLVCPTVDAMLMQTPFV